MNQTINEMITQLELQRDNIERDMKTITMRLQYQNFNKDKLKEFWEQPYAIVNKRPDEWYVICPTFVDFQIGWLEKSVKGWNYFIVNKFVNWLAQVPKDLQEKFHFETPLPLKVFDGMVLTGKEHQDKAWAKYGKHLSKREGSDRLRIKQGHEFELLAQMIGDGILPFMPKPIAAQDYRDVPELTLELRPYQEDAWERFKKVGSVGIFWPFGSGKTLIGIKAMAHIKGDKVVVVPTTTLKEQWEDRINTYIPQFKHEIFVFTYKSYEKIKKVPWSLIIFDECHRLPANTFSRLATVRANYRMGLSATPYREDGRTDFIFALTGYPVGMDWQEIIKSGVVGKPTVTLYILDTEADKIKKIEQLLKDDKKTLIYSYWLQLGEKISKKFSLPFVQGSTTGRLGILKSAQTVVVSSVGGEGVSLPDLERVIEVGFQFGSRREEGQLMGRLFHSTEKEPEHIILMTEEELEAYEKRLLAIYEKGFRINIVR